jgi:hypothetical protein
VTDNSTSYAPVLTYSLPGDFKAFTVEQLKPETRYHVAVRVSNSSPAVVWIKRLTFRWKI